MSRSTVNLSLFCVLDELEPFLAQNSIATDTYALENQQVTFDFEGFNVKISKMTQDAGQRYRSTRLGFVNFIRNRTKGDDKDRKEQVAGWIVKTQIIYGCVIEGHMPPNQSIVDLFLGLAKHCQGIIFDGVNIVDSGGDVLLEAKVL